jgi:hypothetical protein
MARKIFRQFIHNSSRILPRLEEFVASGLASGRIVEGIIREELWKKLVNVAPDHDYVLNPKYIKTGRFFFKDPALLL